MTASPTSRSLKWLRLLASRPCSSKHSFAGYDMSPEWKSIAYQRSCWRIVHWPLWQRGTSENDTKTLCEKVPFLPLAISPTVSGQHKQPIQAKIAQLQRAEGGSSSAKLSGRLRQPPAGRRSFVRRLEFGPRAAHARLCRWLTADMPTVPMVSRS